MDQFGQVIVLSQPSRKVGRSLGLTEQERDVLKGLLVAVERFGNPSLKEIAECAGSTAVGTRYYAPTVHRYLRGLEDKGYIQLPPRYSCRGRIRILKQS